VTHTRSQPALCQRRCDGQGAAARVALVESMWLGGARSPASAPRTAPRQQHAAVGGGGGGGRVASHIAATDGRRVASHIAEAVGGRVASGGRRVASHIAEAVGGRVASHIAAAGDGGTSAAARGGGNGPSFRTAPADRLKSWTILASLRGTCPSRLRGHYRRRRDDYTPHDDDLCLPPVTSLRWCGKFGLCELESAGCTPMCRCCARSEKATCRQCGSSPCGKKA